MTQPSPESGRDQPLLRPAGAGPRILVGVAGDPTGVQTLAAAGRLARRLNAPLIVALVHRSTSASSTMGQALVDLRADLEFEILTQATQVLDPLDVRWHFTVRIGEPCRALRAIADDCDAALIVVGTQGHGTRARLHRLIRGSVSTRLARDETRPVLVVPSPSG
jgi:nucleotide-binding universal stress UspA family protein